MKTKIVSFAVLFSALSLVFVTDEVLALPCRTYHECRARQGWTYKEYLQRLLEERMEERRQQQYRKKLEAEQRAWQQYWDNFFRCSQGQLPIWDRRCEVYRKRIGR